MSGGDFISQTLYLDVVPMLLVPGLEEDSLGPLQPRLGLELEAELPGEAGRGQMVGPGSMGEYSSECPRGGSIISFFWQIQKNKDFLAVIITLLIFFLIFWGIFQLFHLFFG